MRIVFLLKNDSGHKTRNESAGRGKKVGFGRDSELCGGGQETETFHSLVPRCNNNLIFWEEKK